MEFHNCKECPYAKCPNLFSGRTYWDENGNVYSSSVCEWERINKTFSPKYYKNKILEQLLNPLLLLSDTTRIMKRKVAVLGLH